MEKTEESDKIKTTLRIPEELHLRLSNISKETRLSIASLITIAILIKTNHLDLI